MKLIRFFSLQPLAFSLLLAGCATAAPKQVTAYISIDDGAYPVFNLRKPGDPGNVQIKATPEQVAKWKAAAAAYVASQKEIETLVSHYEPLAIKKGKEPSWPPNHQQPKPKP
jgi:outer membrane PBP1 activator LpoA protein